MDHEIVYYFDQSSNIFKRLLILTKFLHGIVKDCQKRLSKLQLGQVIVCPKTFIYCYKSEVKSKRNCLTQDNRYFTRRNVINLFIVYELDTWSRDLSMDFILGDCLFRAVKLVKNPDQDKNGYSGYFIKFDARPQFSLPNYDWGKNVVIFGVDRSSRMKDILVLGEGPTQGLDDTTITAEAKYSINIKKRKKIC